MYTPSSRRERALLLAVILCFLAALKWSFNPGMGRNSLDGNYYFQVARHVAEGDGLMTSVSLYHQGFKELPHRTHIYPLWPLALGWAGRAVPLPAAAVLLPEVLYLVDLVLLYFLAIRLMRRIRGKRDPSLFGGGAVNLGHLAVLLFGVNPVFFNFTSLPYTEALAFAFVFAALLALDRAADRRPVLWGAAAGLLSALAFLTRTQTLGLGIAVVATLALAARAHRRYLGAAAAAAAAIAAVLVPWVLYLASFIRPFNPRVLISVGAYRETPEVEPFRWSVATSGWLDWARDRLAGLAVAFSPRSGSAYTASFGLAAWLAPVGLLRLARRPRDLAAIFDPARMAVTASVLSGLLMLAPIHLLHSRFLSEWRFGHRHGLPLLLLLLPALGYLLARGGRLLRVLGMSLLLLGFAVGAFRSTRLLTADFRSGLLGPEPELVAWLDARRPRPVVLTTHAQTLSVFSRAGFHWMECRESPEQTRRLLEHIDIDYVLLYPGQGECRFAAGLDRLPVAATFGSGARRIRVYDARRE